jgi:hypothetical protein
VRAGRLKRKAPPQGRGFHSINQNALAILVLLIALIALTRAILLLLLAGLLTTALLIATGLAGLIALLLLARLVTRILVRILVLRHILIPPTFSGLRFEDCLRTFPAI